MYRNSCTDPGCLAFTYVIMLCCHGDVRCVPSMMLYSSSNRYQIRRFAILAETIIFADAG